MTGYDMTFCEGQGCARRDTCHRYLHLLVYRADKDPNKPYLISMLMPPYTDPCGMYREEKVE